MLSLIYAVVAASDDADLFDGRLHYYIIQKSFITVAVTDPVPEVHIMHLLTQSSKRRVNTSVLL